MIEYNNLQEAHIELKKSLRKFHWYIRNLNIAKEKYHNNISILYLEKKHIEKRIVFGVDALYEKWKYIKLVEDCVNSL